MSADHNESQLLLSFKKNIRQYIMLGVLFAVWVFFYFNTAGGVFLSYRNLSNLFLQSACVAILAIGMVLVLVTLNIDLSLGSGVGFISSVAAVLMVQHDWGSGTTILVCLCIGLLIGVWHGYWIAYRSVPAFVVTLASMMALRGGILYVTGGKNFPNVKPFFQALGQDYLSNRLNPSFFSAIGEAVDYWRHFIWSTGAAPGVKAEFPVGFGYNTSTFLTVLIVLAYIVLALRSRKNRIRYHFEVLPIGLEVLKIAIFSAAIIAFFGIMIKYNGIPYAWLVVMGMLVIFSVLANRTTFGRYLYAIGGNADAARLSGINSKRMILYLYMIMGMVTAIAGIIFLARLNNTSAQSGAGMEMDAIASVVIGGTSLLGGEGSIFGAVVGALLISSLDNGMQLMNTQVAWQFVIKGLVLLLAVWVDIAFRKKGN